MDEHSGTKNIELAIVGGGPAGMSAALVAGRGRIQTVIINEEAPRNAVTGASHGFLTQDGKHPTEILATAKEQLKKYSNVEYIKGVVSDVVRKGDGFYITVENGSALWTERVILATGYRDHIDEISLPGIEQVYGKSVFPCPFCDGWEHRDQKLALFGAGDGLAHYVPLITNWSNDLTVFTNGERLEQEQKDHLLKGSIQLVEEPVIELLSTPNGKLKGVRLASGDMIERESGFLLDPRERPANDFAERLGVERESTTWAPYALKADKSGKTEVKGLYVVGDTKNGFTGVAGSVADGASCVENMVFEGVLERWEQLQTKKEIP